MGGSRLDTNIGPLIEGNNYGISLSKLQAIWKHHYAIWQILPSINACHQTKWIIIGKGLTSYITLFHWYQYFNVETIAY